MIRELLDIWHHVPYIGVVGDRATLVHREKVIDESGNIAEVVIWTVPGGVRYRLAFIRPSDVEPVVLYDNHHPKGPHRHIEGIEEPYPYTGLDRLLLDFRSDVRRVMRGAK